MGRGSAVLLLMCAASWGYNSSRAVELVIQQLGER